MIAAMSAFNLARISATILLLFTDTTFAQVRFNAFCQMRQFLQKHHANVVLLSQSTRGAGWENGGAALAFLWHRIAPGVSY